MATLTKVDYNSTTNQNIKQRFVGIHVHYGVSQIITHLLQSDDKGDYEEELYNVSSQPDFETAAENNGWTYNNDLEIWEHEEESETFSTAQEVCEEHNLDYEYREAYEFWIVSDYLAEKLKEHGEMVEEIMGLTVWGRCTTGQAILLDYCISKVCQDMEILEGQKNEWS